MTTAVELHDVQGLVARGFGNLPAAAFLLVAIEDRSAGHAWLDDVAAALDLAIDPFERIGRKRQRDLSITHNSCLERGSQFDVISRDSPRRITVFPGGGSLIRAKYPPSRAILMT